MKDIPTAMKWLMNSPRYTILNEWGKSVYNEKKGIEMFLKIFPDYYTSEELKRNSDSYNLENLFLEIKDSFYSKYGYYPKSELVSKYNGMLNSLYDGGNIRFVYVDELLQLSVILFIATLLTWDDKNDDLETYSICFRFTLFLLNDVCIFGEIPSKSVFQDVLPRFLKDIHIVELSEECFWTIMAFTLAHELAHEYLSLRSNMSHRADRKKNIDYEEEFQADRIAYDIVLNNIIEANPKKIKLKNYTYLAPMMYMDFFDLFYYTDRVLYKKRIPIIDHPLPNTRKAALFRIVDDDKYDFDTEDGNDLYNCFLNSFDLFKEELLLKEQRGKLRTVTYTSRRERLEG